MPNVTQEQITAALAASNDIAGAAASPENVAAYLVQNDLADVPTAIRWVNKYYDALRNGEEAFAFEVGDEIFETAVAEGGV